MNDQPIEDSQQRQSTDDLDKLYSLREQAVGALLPNLEKIDGVTPERKFEIYLSAVRTTHDIHLAESALAAAMGIQDPALQSESLLDLVQEINYSIQLQESDK